MLQGLLVAAQGDSQIGHGNKCIVNRQVNPDVVVVVVVVVVGTVDDVGAAVILAVVGGGGVSGVRTTRTLLFRPTSVQCAATPADCYSGRPT